MKINIFGLLLFYFHLACSHNINVDLSAYHPHDDVFKNYYELSDYVNTILVKNINGDVGFFLIQVHSYIENVSLSYYDAMLKHSHVKGTNIGLFSNNREDIISFYIFRTDKVGETANILLTITLYDVNDPVPGGCNLSFDTKIAPYQFVTYSDELITVKSQPPSAYGVSCDANKVQVDMYHLFLTEYDNKNTTYFDGIEKMISVSDIKTFGRKVPAIEGYFKYRRLYSLYRGNGEVFVIVATYKNRSSAYVPAVSYGCDVLDWNNSCMGPVTEQWRFICAAFLIFGLFTCFLGHRFFRFTLFMMGFTFGVIVTLFVMSLEEHLTAVEKTTTSFILGFFYGIVWVLIWWKFGKPLLSVHVGFLLASFLIASIVFYAGLADIPAYNSDINFWITFFSIVIGCLIIWMPLAMLSNIFTCSFLGSYACVVAFNYYLGGNLQYIMINTYRRITTKHFNYAVIDPPFQFVDTVHSVYWTILVLIGCIVQWRRQKGKPPFPSNRNIVTLTANDLSERRALLDRENEPVPQYVNPGNVPPPQYVYPGNVPPPEYV